MATPESARKLAYPCKYCGEHTLRRFGRISLGYVECRNPDCSTRTPEGFVTQFMDEYTDLRKRERINTKKGVIL